MAASVYEPINVYKAVGPGIGIVDGPLEYMTIAGIRIPLPFTTRMTVVRLQRRRLVRSPYRSAARSGRQQYFFRDTSRPDSHQAIDRVANITGTDRGYPHRLEAEEAGLQGPHGNGSRRRSPEPPFPLEVGSRGGNAGPIGSAQVVQLTSACPRLRIGGPLGKAVLLSPSRATRSSGRKDVE